MSFKQKIVYIMLASQFVNCSFLSFILGGCGSRKQKVSEPKKITQEDWEKQIPTSDDMYQVECSNQQKYSSQQKIAKNYFPQCYTKIDFGNVLTQRNFKGEGQFGEVFVFQVNAANTKKYAFKKILLSQDDLTEIKNEIKISELLGPIEDINIPKYYGCYVYKSVKNIYIILQYDALAQDLEFEVDGYDRKYIKNDMRGFFQYSKDVQIQKFVNLFKTLSILHDTKYKYSLKDIKPANIMSNQSMKPRSDGDFYPEFELYFIDLGFVLHQVSDNNLAGTPYYLHPQTYIFKKNQDPLKDDVYALCSSYFEIQIKRYSKKSNNGYWTKPKIFVNEDIDVKQWGRYDLSNPQQKIKQSIISMKKRIWQNFLKKKQQDGQFLFPDFDELNNNISQALKENNKVNDIANACKLDPECIIYSGIQVDYENTPSSLIIYKALLKVNNQQLRQILI